MDNTVTPIKAIRDYFESDGGRKTNVTEIKALTPEDKAELAPLCAEALGKVLVEVAKA